MTRTSFFGMVLATAGLAATAACGEAPAGDEAESAENAQTVDPTGTNGRGTVTVNVPAFFSPTFSVGAEKYAYTLSFNGTDVKPGTPTLVTPAANDGNWGCLDTTLNRVQSGRLAPIARGHECIWQLPSGGSVTIDLGIAKVWWSGYPQVRGDVFAVAPPSGSAVSRVWQDARYAQYRGTSRYAFYAKNDIPLLLVPGDYEYSTGDAAYPPKPFKVVAGQQTDFNADYDSFLATQAVAYSPAAFADAPSVSAAPVLACGYAMSRVQGRWTSLLVMLDRDSMDCALQLAAGGASVPVTLTRGNTASVALGRLDVNDVTLLDEGNRQVAGKFNVRARVGTDWGPWILKSASPTHRGLDLPKGHYQVQVDYVAAVGPKTSFYEVDLE